MAGLLSCSLFAAWVMMMLVSFSPAVIVMPASRAFPLLAFAVNVNDVRLSEEVFDFSVAGIINNLSLTKVTYKPVAAYGHFGRTELNLPWERLDKVTVLQEKAVARMAEEICKNR